MTNRIWSLTYRLGAALVALVVAFPMLGSPAAHADEPEIVYQNLNDGQIIAEPPYVIQLCFAQPIDIRDQPDGGDWDFDIVTPQGQGSAIRIVFQPDGYGVAMYPVAPPTLAGIPTSDTNDWAFIYHVADQESGDAIDGTISFQVSEDASPIPRETPPSCVPEGGTGQATPPPVTGSADAATNTPVPTRTPRTSPTPVASGSAPASGSAVASGSGSATPTSSTPGDDEEDDGGSDAVLYGLIAVGAIGIVGGLGAIAYVVRRRRGPPASP